MESQTLTLDLLENAIKQKDVIALRAIFETYPLIDIAELSDKMADSQELLFIFKTVKSVYTAEFFSYLSPEVQEKLVRIFTDKDLMALISNSYTDKIAVFLTEMPANLVDRILAVSETKTRDLVNRLLNYKAETAGSLMTSEFVTLKVTDTVGEAIEHIRLVGHKAETISINFVVDDKQDMIGTVGLETLVLAKQDKPIEELMDKNFLFVGVDVDQEEVAHQFKRYNLNAMPVLDDDHHLVGIITVDDIIDVIVQEASEDIAKMAAVTPLEDSYIKSSVWVLAKKCIPWVIILFVLGLGASVILNIFESYISVLPILAAFIPILMDAGGNAGTQTSSLVTRSMALKEIRFKDMLKVAWKEIRVALIVSLFAGAFAFIWVLFEFGTGILHYEALDGLTGWAWYQTAGLIAGLVALTLALAITFAKTVGACLPLLTKAVGLDPAIIASPLLDTLVDVSTLLIFFFLSSNIFGLI